MHVDVQFFNLVSKVRHMRLIKLQISSDKCYDMEKQTEIENGVNAIVKV